MEIMKDLITHKGKFFRYKISRGTNRIYRRGRKEVIVDKTGNIEPYRGVFYAKGESK